MIKRLVMGCGMRPKKGDSNTQVINLDKENVKGVDVVHDLEVFPYPFENNSFDHIEAEDVLEHVRDIVGIMQEVWRILRPGGTIWIRGPHASYPLQAWKDPTHIRLFVPDTFNNWDPTTFDGKHYGHYFGKGKFKVVWQKEVNKGMEYLLSKI